MSITKSLFIGKIAHGSVRSFSKMVFTHRNGNLSCSCACMTAIGKNRVYKVRPQMSDIIM
jgi:hypothetical protein